MKEGKMITIEELLKKIVGEEKRKFVESKLCECLYAICCEDSQWRKYRIYYNKGKDKIMFYFLENPEFVMAIADHIENEMDGVETVKIALSKGKERNLSFIRLNYSTVMVTVFIPKKEWDLAENK